MKIALVIHGIRGGKVIVIPGTSYIRKSVFKIQDSICTLSFPPKRGVQISIAFAVFSFHISVSSKASTTVCAGFGFCVSNLQGYVLRGICVVLLCDCLDSVADIGCRIVGEGDATCCNYSMVFELLRKHERPQINKL